MGVAGGRFVPSSDYDANLHAFSINVEAELSARSAEFGLIPCQGVMIEDSGVIEDSNEKPEEMNVIILGIPYPEYDTFFASYALYRAYWGSLA